MSKTALFAAAKAWDANRVRRLLTESPGLESAQDSKGRSALHIAAGTNADKAVSCVDASLATARVLLDAGVDVNAVHEIPDDAEIFAATPLWYALARGRNATLARFLLSAGANPDHCLYTVIWTRETDLLRMLLDAGSRTEVRFDGETPLLYAARLAREEAVLALVAAGADLNARDSKGRSPVDHAREKRLSPAVLSALGDAPETNRQRSRKPRTA